MVMRRASTAASTGSVKVSAIWSSSVMPSALSDGLLDTGTGSSGTSRAVRPSAVMSTFCSGLQASAGRNCSARGPSHCHAPATAGCMVTKRSGASSGPPACGPRSRSKNNVTGSQLRRKRSGTTLAPSARCRRSSWPLSGARRLRLREPGRSPARAAARREEQSASCDATSSTVSRGGVRPTISRYCSVTSGGGPAGGGEMPITAGRMVVVRPFAGMRASTR